MDKGEVRGRWGTEDRLKQSFDTKSRAVPLVRDTN